MIIIDRLIFMSLRQGRWLLSLFFILMIPMTAPLFTSSVSTLFPLIQRTLFSSQRYYRLHDGTVIDSAHINRGIQRIRALRPRVAQGGIFTYQDIVKGNVVVQARYWVSPNLTAAQVDGVTLAIAMDYEHEFEANQYWYSRHSIEDLPSDYLGYFLGFHPDWNVERLLRQLNHNLMPATMGELRAIPLHLRKRNQMFKRRVNGDHLDWMPPFKMEIISQTSGLWQPLTVDVGRLPKDQVATSGFSEAAKLLLRSIAEMQ